MKEELTREVLEAIKNCDDRKCASCPAKCVCVSGVDIVHIDSPPPCLRKEQSRRYGMARRTKLIM